MNRRYYSILRLLTCGLLLTTATHALCSSADSTVITLRPVKENAWSKDLNLKDEATVKISDDALPGFCDIILRLDELYLRVALRQKAHAQWLKTTEEVEEIETKSRSRFDLIWRDRVYRFDYFGKLMLDLRFTDIEDGELISRFEAQYRNFLAASEYGKAEPTKPKEQPQAKVLSVPIFNGFEDDRYQKYDALILKLVTEFNANRSAWAGADAGVTLDIPELQPALIKAMMLEESGGNGPRSREAWDRDPLQVNVPGDWDDSKKSLGLTRPRERNEGTLENNLRAGIKYLVRKGFGTSGRPVSNRSKGYFDSWRTALKRYNGRKDRLHDGRSYRSAYADRILRRAKRPDRFVPIAH
ncbi:MAG: hypothetical protein IKZ27_07610 [Kiritimatiellae bacterium]|nr:hypothetical protein [Kiritimatiellia bacterium]